MSQQGAVEPLDAPRAKSLFAICIVFPFLASLAVAARFYSRHLKSMKLGADDWMILIGLLFFYTQAIISIIGIFLGLSGHHVSDLSMAELIVATKCSVWAQYSYALAMGLTRCSICILLIRIFSTQSFKRIASIVLLLNAAWILFSIFFISLRCIPFAKNWNPSLKGHCTGQHGFIVAVAAWGLVCDGLIWSLPIPMVLRLHLPLAHRLALCAVFAMGILDIIIGVVRVVSVLDVNFNDFVWSGTPAIEWAIIEPGVAILVASGPILRPLFDKLIPHTFLRTARTKTSSSDRQGGFEHQAYNTLNDDQFELVPKKAGISDSAYLEASSITKAVALPTAAVNPSSQDYSNLGVLVRKDITVERGQC